MTVKERLKQWVEELSEEEAVHYFERFKEDRMPLNVDAARQKDSDESGETSAGTFTSSSLEERRRRVKEARGSAAHLNLTVEDIHRSRREELELEEEQAERRRGGIG